MTVKKYLESIEDQDVRGRALANMDSEKENDQVKSLEHALYWAFKFHRAPEGYDYWIKIYSSLKQ